MNKKFYETPEMETVKLATTNSLMDMSSPDPEFNGGYSEGI